MATDVGLLIVGNELLDGIVLDTNSQWLINQLKILNLHVKERMTVRDEAPAISRALGRLADDGCNLIITVGGLGPTHDDITLSGVAEAFGLGLELDRKALNIVTRQYNELCKRGIVDTAEITEARMKMAKLPKGSTPLDNRIGGAPGVVLDVDGRQIICLPGVPKELMWIFENRLVKKLRKRSEGAYAEKIIHLPLKDESTLAPIIDDVMEREPTVYVKSMVKPYGEAGIRLWICSSGQIQSEVEECVVRAITLLKRLAEERLPKTQWIAGD